MRLCRIFATREEGEVASRGKGMCLCVGRLYIFQQILTEEEVNNELFCVNLTICRRVGLE